MIENVLLKKFLHTSPHTPQEAGAVTQEQRIGVNSSSQNPNTPLNSNQLQNPPKIITGTVAGGPQITPHNPRTTDHESGGGIYGLFFSLF